MVEWYRCLFAKKEIMEALKLELMGLPPDFILTDEIKFFGTPLNDKMLTMIGYSRLTNIEYLIHEVLSNNIGGDLIETGVWRGGACIFMAKLLEQWKSDKKVFVADSFEGLPKPDEKYPHDKGDYHHAVDFLNVSIETVLANLVKYNTLKKSVIVKGWFKDTLHLIENKFSIIRLDGDMYESTINALDALYPKLSIGGYCIIDDYGGVPNCPFAVDNYRKEHNIMDEMINIDNTGIYWQKTK